MSTKIKKEWQCVSFQVEKLSKFPLTGSELKEVLRNFWAVKLLLYSEEDYKQWMRFNPETAENLDKLLTWASQYEKSEVKSNEQPTA